MQEGQFERVGEERTRKVDVRIIAATNRDLRQEVAAKHFREDLYFRLNVFPIQSPALRERPIDIAPLAAHFLKQTGKRLNMPGRRLRNSDIERLQSYSWPGNIRELQNVIERALITSVGADLNLDLPDEPKTTVTQKPSLSSQIMTDAQIRELERNNMQAALKASDGKLFGKGGAAELLGLKPTTLASRFKRLEIKLEH
ncbi:Formate hydrogenlyase transcriptional activator [compost metagenome]